MGWNDLAFLSVFFFFSLFFFWFLELKGGRMGWESFLSSGSRKKRQKGKQNATEQDSHQTMTAMEGNMSSYGYCSEENGNLE